MWVVLANARRNERKNIKKIKTKTKSERKRVVGRFCSVCMRVYSSFFLHFLHLFNAVIKLNSFEFSAAPTCVEWFVCDWRCVGPHRCSSPQPRSKWHRHGASCIYIQTSTRASQIHCILSSFDSHANVMIMMTICCYFVYLSKAASDCMCR